MQQAYEEKQMKLLRFVMFSVILMVLIVGCGKQAQAGWTSETKVQLRQELCPTTFDLNPNSSDCFCIAQATIDTHANPKDFRNSTAPSRAYESALADCGFELISRN